jgi:hypothetical protein
MLALIRCLRVKATVSNLVGLWESIAVNLGTGVTLGTGMTLTLTIAV